MISVVIPLYNKAGLVRRTIESVLAQTYTDYEIVVVDDGSTDGSAAVIEAINDPRIRLISQQNAGVSAARNRGIAEAKSEYIALLDADDVWEPGYLETLASMARQYPQCDVFCANYDFVDHKGISTPTIINKLPFDGVSGELTNYFEVASCSHPPICSITIMARKGVFESIGGFPEDASHGEDLLTWARIACRYRIAYTKDVLAHYMLGPNFGNNSKPVNIPQGNVVGEKLESLLKSTQPVPKGLKQYIGRWYKIRSNIFLRGGEKRNALINMMRTVRFRPQEWKIYVYMAMLVLPTALTNKLFKRL